MTTHAAKVIAGDGGTIRYITAKEDGKDAWYILELFPEQYADYKKQMKTGNLLLSTFGTILASGWAAQAPEAILKQYGINS